MEFSRIPEFEDCLYVHYFPKDPLAQDWTTGFLLSVTGNGVDIYGKLGAGRGVGYGYIGKAFDDFEYQYPMESTFYFLYIFDSALDIL